MPNQLSINTCRVGRAGGITAGGGGQHTAPDTSYRKISADLPGKEGARKNGEKKENQKVKGRWKIENGRRKSYKMRRRLFVFLFTFQNHWNMFWVYQNGNFLPGKGISHRAKNQERYLCPLWKNIPLTPLVGTSTTFMVDPVLSDNA